MRARCAPSRLRYTAPVRLRTECDPLGVNNLRCEMLKCRSSCARLLNEWVSVAERVVGAGFGTSWNGFGLLERFWSVTPYLNPIGCDLKPALFLASFPVVKLKNGNDFRNAAALGLEMISLSNCECLLLLNELALIYI